MKSKNFSPYGVRECFTELPKYFLLTNPAWTNLLVCSDMVLILHLNFLEILSSVIPLLLLISNKMSIRW